MDNQGKKESESSPEHLSGKATKRTTKSEASKQGGPRDRLKQPHELSNECGRLTVHLDCRLPLKRFVEKWKLKSMGAAVRWMLPSDIESFVDVTKELGYETGGQTVDSLLQGGGNLLCLKKEKGFENARETLEWCVPDDNNTKRLVELTKELGLDNGAQTLDLLLSVASQLKTIAAVKDIPPALSSAMNIPAQSPPEQFQEPGFQHLGGAPEPSSSWEQQSFITNHNLQPPALGLLAGNHSLAVHPLQESIAEELIANQFQGNEIHEDFRFPSTLNEQPHHQLKGSIRIGGEKQSIGSNSFCLPGGQIMNQYFNSNRDLDNLSNSFKRGEIHEDFRFPLTVNEQPHHQLKGSIRIGGEKQSIGSNSLGLQGGQIMNQYLNSNRDLDNLFNSFKRGAAEAGNNDHRANKLPSRFPTVPGENRAINLARNTVREQGLKKNTININGVERASDQGYQNTSLAGMPLENYGNQYFHQPGIHQPFPHVPMNQVIHHRTPAQIQFEVADWNVYQNQGGTQMGGTHGRHRGSSSKEEQKYAGTVNKLGTGKAPKRS